MKAKEVEGPENVFILSMRGIVMEQKVLSKVIMRLVPFMILLYLLNYLDRVNVSVAALQMNKVFGFTDSVYAFGVGIFFVGYCVFEIPSNLIMERVGARIWIARIMISWGLISAAMMFIGGRYSFYVLRFLLGVAEAGFFPGMILYLTYWIPARQRAQAGAWFLTSTALAGVVGNPLAGLLLKMNGIYGLGGWQWLFLLEGLPTVFFGLIVLLVLPDRPQQANWLAPRERAWLEQHLEAERREHHGHGHVQLRHAFTKKVWLLSAVYSLLLFGFYGIVYWTPTIVKSISGQSDSLSALYSAVPSLAAAIGMVLISRHSDRSGERRLHVAVCALVGCAGLLLAAFTTSSTILTLAGLSIAAVGIWGTLGPFWAMPTIMLGGTAAAAGIALINSIGNFFGGFVGQILMGRLKDATGSYMWGLLVDALALALAAALLIVLHIGEAPAQATQSMALSEAAGTIDRLQAAE